MGINLKNNPAKFHPDLTWHEWSLGFFWAAQPQQEEEQKQGE